MAKPTPLPRFCVFCGKPPQDKNNEHVLPQWLLEATGDPNRVVQIGHNYDANKPIRFAWDALVMPACKTCNDEFGRGLEQRVKPVVERLLDRQPLSAGDYVLLLDWLDKVRIGLWLNYMVLQKFHSGVTPNFHIRDRIGTKDRMLSVYPFDSQPRGLNAIGVESLLFHHTPCCFTLRVNDLMIFNMSGDFLFADRCGFPASKSVAYIGDGPNAGRMQLGAFVTKRATKQRLFLPRLIKPAVQLYQPILCRHPAKPDEFLGDASKADPYLARYVADWTSGQGVLFRQYDRHVTKLTKPTDLVAFDAVTGNDCRPAGYISAQTYDLQCTITERQRHVVKDQKKLARFQQDVAGMIKLNRDWAELLRNTTGPNWRAKLIEMQTRLSASGER